ncbi:MAG: sigma factor-like helix-turn-helix DNA-binding protein [Nitriliruptorales bacterium]
MSRRIRTRGIKRGGRRVSVDAIPTAFSEGDEESDFASATSAPDRYFAGDIPNTSALGLVLDRMLERLPQDERDCLHLVVVSGMSQRRAAELLGWILPSGHPDGKKVARAIERATAQLRKWLTGASWVEALLEGRITDLGDE